MKQLLLSNNEISSTFYLLNDWCNSFFQIMRVTLKTFKAVFKAGSKSTFLLEMMSIYIRRSPEVGRTGWACCFWRHQIFVYLLEPSDIVGRISLEVPTGRKVNIIHMTAFIYTKDGSGLCSRYFHDITA